MTRELVLYIFIIMFFILFFCPLILSALGEYAIILFYLLSAAIVVLSTYGVIKSVQYNLWRKGKK